MEMDLETGERGGKAEKGVLGYVWGGFGVEVAPRGHAMRVCASIRGINDRSVKR